MNDEQERYLHRVVEATLKFAGAELSEEDIWDLIMLELVNIHA
jgi:hypothetical protein